MADSNLSLWDFSVAVYSQEGVEALSLLIQDDLGINIPLLLFCYWSGLRYGAASPTQIQASLKVVESWSNIVVNPLRHIRCQMKARARQFTTLNSEQTNELREKIKTLELNSEKILLQGLEEFSKEWPKKSGSINDVFLNIEMCFGQEKFKLLKDKLAHLTKAVELVYKTNPL
jgi:uncharacterized protein (TIGR02444 family)